MRGASLWPTEALRWTSGGHAARCRRPVLVAFWAFGILGTFPNGEYPTIVVTVEGQVVQHNKVYHAYFAFPFMGRDCFQVGNTLTLLEFCTKRLASLAL